MDQPPDGQLVHLLTPSPLQFCDNDCQREACLRAIREDTPLLCEALSREDVDRIQTQWGEEKLREVYQADAIYKIGLAYLLVMAEHENRKKYHAQELAEAIFAFLRVARDDPHYDKRVTVLLLSVLRTREHFNLGDLKEMFGEAIYQNLLTLLPRAEEKWDTQAYCLRLKPTPLAPLVTAFYKAKLDWLALVAPEHTAGTAGKRWRKALAYLN